VAVAALAVKKAALAVLNAEVSVASEARNISVLPLLAAHLPEVSIHKN
jgi:hypothetical protein